MTRRQRPRPRPRPRPRQPEVKVLVLSALSVAKQKKKNCLTTDPPRVHAFVFEAPASGRPQACVTHTLIRFIISFIMVEVLSGGGGGVRAIPSSPTNGTLKHLIAPFTKI